MATGTEKKRHPWCAAMLSITGIPIGQIYSGNLYRALLIAFVFLIVLPFVTVAVLNCPLNKFWTLTFFALALLSPIAISADAFLVARRNECAKIRWWQRWWFYAIAYIIAVVAGSITSSLNRTYIADSYVVPGQSMWPTIYHNDRVMADKFFSSPADLERNDVVVFETPEADSLLRLSRVMGLPGEVIEVRAGKLLVNENPLLDRFAFFSDGPALFPELTNYGPIKIPEGSYFLISDNRNESLDSRIFGPVPAENVVGIAKLIFWSNDYSFPPDRRQDPQIGKVRWDRIGNRLD